MSLNTLLNPANILQTIALALSMFNLVAFLWLACTVWLNGDRRRLITRVGVVGLGLAALFFFIHALLISSPLSQPSGLMPLNFLWRLIWLPALGATYIWFVIGLYYAALINERWRRRRPLLLACSGLLGCAVLVLLILNQSTFTFAGTLRLLAYGYARGDTSAGLLPPFVLLPLLFLIYVAFCAIGPWFTPRRVGRLLRVLWHVGIGRKKNVSLRRSLVDVFWDDQADAELLEEPELSWHLARPVLLLAALLMVGLIIIIGGLGIWSMANWLKLLQGTRLFTPIPFSTSLRTIPPGLVLLDIIAIGSLALIILLVGYSIVRYGILIERPLGRRGFFEQWRGIVIVATTVAIIIALFVALTHSSLSSLGGLLFITCLATGAYALFTWSSYTAHDRYVMLLRPFLRSTNLRHWLNTDLRKTEQGMEDLFFHLCHDVLEVQWARLVVLAGPMRRSFNYRWPIFDGQDELEEQPKNVRIGKVEEKEDYQVEAYSGRSKAASIGTHRVRVVLQGQPVICWILPIYDELEPVARLYLGPRQDGGVFTDEDMDLAQACGQRILDTLRDHEAMLAVASLLRRRIVDVKLVGAQQRRVLHDEILPQMHLALLRLETLRSVVQNGHKDDVTTRSDQALTEAITIISDAHRQLAAMMRATTTSAPHHLERDGMMHAIYTMIEQDFQQAFDEVEWAVSEDEARHIDEIVPPAIAELIFAAVQEVLRNAARHARGSDVHRRLRLTLKASYNSDLEVVVADDGVGIGAASTATTGTGGGLLTHRALLAIAGGSLTVKSAPGEGVTVRIQLPAGSLR